MLAVPALLLWHRNRRSARRNLGRFYRSHSFLLLGCLLALLFPVVSATDDLHALRPEAEESNSTRRIVKQFHAQKVPLSLGGHTSPALLSTVASFGPEIQRCGTVSLFAANVPERLVAFTASPRAPPALQLL